MKEQYVQLVAKEDIKCLCENHGTNMPAITRLLSGGIPLYHADEVLEIRDQLSESWIGSRGNLYHDVASIETIVKAYHATEGDIDLLGAIAEASQYRASEIVGEAWRFGRDKRIGVHSRALLEITEHYLQRGRIVLE